MKIKSMKRVVIAVAMLFSTPILASDNEVEVILSEKQAEKIRFDLSLLNYDGLMGNADSLAAVDYEFCIPANEQYVEEVRYLDPSIKLHQSSPGRIGCNSNEYLIIGNTHQPDFKMVLTNLAKLSYVERIERCFWE